MARVKLDLSIPDRGKFQAALAEAKRRGLDVSRTFEDLGLASGFIEASAIDALLKIDGIASVVPDRDAIVSGDQKDKILHFRPKKR